MSRLQPVPSNVTNYSPFIHCLLTRGVMMRSDAKGERSVVMLSLSTKEDQRGAGGAARMMRQRKRLQ